MNSTPLSQRIRPGSEAAPWVCDEIARLERELEELKSSHDALLRKSTDVSTCAKGHHFRTISTHPAKSEREWECPHCAVAEREQLRRELAEIRADWDKHLETLSQVTAEKLHLEAKLTEANSGNWYGAGIKIATALALAKREPEDIADAVDRLIVDLTNAKTALKSIKDETAKLADATSALPDCGAIHKIASDALDVISTSTRFEIGTGESYPQNVLCRVELPVPIDIMAAITKAIAAHAESRTGKKAFMRQVGNHIEFFVK